MKKVFLMATFLGVAVLGNAQYKEFNPQEKNLLRIHNEELTKSTALIAEELWYKNVKSFNMNAEAEDSKRLYQLIYERELRKQMCNIYLKDNLNYRYEKKSSIDQEYEDTICRVMAPYWNMGLPNLYTAILNRKGLGLTDTQYNDIVTNMIRLKPVAERSYNSLWGEELKALQETLDNEQIDIYFRAKNARIATRDTKIFWQRLKDAGMTNDLDSTVAVAKIFVHRLKIMQAADLYWNNEAKKREAWKAIDYYAPLEMRRVYSIDRKNYAKKQGYKGSFNW
ncbi:MAG: hypothetical protein IJX44_05510 [Bacteroidaceae bacterium]|nr:hypothetical protein [Bacteroidaceae bacterium]